MKKYKIVFLILISLIAVYLVGCNNSSNKLTIKREQLTKKEEFFFNSTGIYHNYVYKIDGISKNKNYELLCWIEEYKDGKLISKDDISKFYINENNNVDSSLYLVFNIEDGPSNTLGISVGTLSDVPNTMVVKKKSDAHFLQGVGSSLNGIDINSNQDIAILGFSKAYDDGRDTSIDLDNFNSIEKDIQENDQVRLIKIKLVED